MARDGAARLIIGTRSAGRTPPGRRMPWLDTTRPRPRCPAAMTAGAGDTVTRYTCDRAEGHRGGWHHDQRGYYWRPTEGYAGLGATANLVDRCATPGHAHQWAEPWAEHIPGAPPITTGHRAHRRTQ